MDHRTRWRRDRRARSLGQVRDRATAPGLRGQPPASKASGGIALASRPDRRRRHAGPRRRGRHSADRGSRYATPEEYVAACAGRRRWPYGDTAPVDTGRRAEQQVRRPVAALTPVSAWSAASVSERQPSGPAGTSLRRPRYRRTGTPTSTTSTSSHRSGDAPARSSVSASVPIEPRPSVRRQPRLRPAIAPWPDRRDPVDVSAMSGERRRRAVRAADRRTCTADRTRRGDRRRSRSRATGWSSPSTRVDAGSCPGSPSSWRNAGRSGAPARAVATGPSATCTSRGRPAVAPRLTIGIAPRRSRGRCRLCSTGSPAVDGARAWQAAVRLVFGAMSGSSSSPTRPPACPPRSRRSAGSSSCRSRWSSARRRTTRASTARRRSWSPRRSRSSRPVSHLPADAGGDARGLRAAVAGRRDGDRLGPPLRAT